MATLTKTQIRKRMKDLLEKLESIKAEIEELNDDIESEAYGIEPYDGREDLTQQQEERQEWLEECHSYIEDFVEYLSADEVREFLEIEEE